VSFIIIDDPYNELSEEDEREARRVLKEWYEESSIRAKADARITFGCVSLPYSSKDWMTPYCDKMLEDAARKGL